MPRRLRGRRAARLRRRHRTRIANSAPARCCAAPGRSLRQHFPQFEQLSPALRTRLGERQLELLGGLENDARDDEPRIALVVGGYDIPGRTFGAGRAQAFFVGLHVVLPIFPLFYVGEAEFPVLARTIDALDEA